MSASESSESDDMTAEEQNLRNSEKDGVHRVIGNFMQIREETLEELVGGFMYLTIDDVRRSTNSAVKTALEKQTQNDSETASAERSGMSGLDDILTHPMPVNTSQSSATQRIFQNSKKSGVSSSSAADDLEEGTLECPETQHDSHALLRNRPASLTKFDNFITTEDGCFDKAASDDGEDKGEMSDEEWLKTPGYTASFDTAASGKQEPAMHAGETTSAGETEPASPGKAEFSLLAGSGSHVPVFRLHQAQVTTSKSGAEMNITNLTLRTENPSEMQGTGRQLNPGEAEDEEAECSSVVQTFSILDFSTRTEAGTGDLQTQPAPILHEECSNEVVPFALDEDFDYDNVAYTPKYTQAEMEYLSLFLPQKS